MGNKGRGAGFGIFLLTIGIIWLLSMVDIVNWSTLNALITLWPLVLIAVGVGFIFRNNRIVRTGTWLVLLTIIISYGYFFPSRTTGFKFDFHVGDYQNSRVLIDKGPQVEKGELTLKYGAVKVIVDSGDTGLVDANVNKALVEHSVESKDEGRTVSATFKMKDEINLAALDKLQNEFHLNRDVIWDLSLKAGATTGELDLGGLKVARLDIETGLTTLDITMGSYNTEMSIGSGISSINITLPQDTGMKVKIGGLNNSNLKGDGWVKDGDWYYSPGYDTKTYKINAEIKDGVGSLDVKIT